MIHLDKERKMFKRFSILFIVLAITLSVVGGVYASAPNAPTGPLTVTPPKGPDLSATRAWTKAEMLAAKPYPLITRQTDALPGVDALVGPDGPAGSVAAGRPTNTAAKSLEAVSDLLAESGVDLLGYSYPPPFTRQDLRNITTPYTKWPFITIGKLFFNQNGGSYVCSAASIASSSASHAIMTAGHCINDGAGHWSTNMVFVPAYNNGAAPYGQWTIIYATERAFVAWTRNGDLARDVAGAKVYNNDGVTLAQKVGWLGFAWNWSRVQHWWEIGYPQASPFTGAWMIACQASYAYDSPFGSSPNPMGVGCDMTGGCSGGPWVWKMGAGNYLNGVNSHRRTGFSKELYSPYMDGAVKTNLWALLVAP
jgi:V8-like Glu-specific endopeptidase